MRLTDFFEHVERDEALQGVDVIMGDQPDLDRVILQDIHTGQKVSVPAGTIARHDWDALRRVALGEADSQPLYHVTRIVGYFSRIENWNKSKLGELADRRQGDYRVAPGMVSEELQQMSMSA